MDTNTSTFQLIEHMTTENTIGLMSNSTDEYQVASVISSSHQIGLAYIIIGVTGIVSNFFVLVVMLNNKSIRENITNMYIMNQSCIDFTVSLLMVATARVNSHVPYSGLAGVIYCKMWQSKVFLLGWFSSSTYNLMALTLERYSAIVYPIWHKTSFTKFKVKVSFVFIWLMGPMYQSLIMPTTSIVINGQCSVYSQWPNKIAYTIYGVTNVIFEYFIPILILVCAYSKIALVLHKRVQKSQGKNQGGTSKQDDKWRRGRRNTIQTLVLVAVSFVSCWTINQIYYFMFTLGYTPEYVSDFYHGTVIAIHCNLCVNPFIYSLKYEPFQNAARHLFCRCLPGGTKVGIVVGG